MPTRHDPFSALSRLLAGDVSRRALLGGLGPGGFAATVGLASTTVSAQVEPPPPPEPVPPVVTAWADAWARHDSARVAALYADDGTYEDVAYGTAVHGPDQIRLYAEATIRAIGGLQLALQTAFGTVAFSPAGVIPLDYAASEWIRSGTDQGLIPGVAPTGHYFAVRGATIFELRSGQIVRTADYYSLATILRQLGLKLTCATATPAASTP